MATDTATAPDVLIDDVAPIISVTKQCPICEYPEPFSGEFCSVCGQRYCDRCVTQDERGEWVCRGCKQQIDGELAALAEAHDGRRIDEQYALRLDRQMGVL